jgi:hypothetical protein
MNFDETIFIEVDEEIPSLVEKMKAAEGKTIALVVPKNAMVLQSVVNLKLLSREAERYGKKISLVTTDRLGRHLALQVGIPVFEDLKAESPVSEIARATPPSEEILEVDLTSKKKAPPVPVHHYLGGEPKHIPVSGAETHIRFPKPPKWLVIALGVVAVLLLALFYPRTSVVLGVKTEPYTGDVDAVLDKSAKELVTNSSILPATQFFNEQEKTQSFPATGEKETGDKAAGTVTVYNCYQETNLTLPKDTSVVNDNLIFKTTASVTIAGATIVGTNCVTAKQADVGVVAEKAGTEYNLEKNKTFKVANYPQSGSRYVFATNSENFSGGTASKKVTVASADDLSKAFESLKNELFLSTLSKVKEEVQDDRKAMFDNAVNQQVISQSSDKKEGDEATEFSATLKAKTETLGFVEAAYREMVINLAGLRLPEGKELIVGAADEIETQVSESDWEKGVVKLKVQIRTHVADAIDTEAVRRAVRGKSLGTAYSYTQGLPGVVDVVIDTRPRLLGRVAFLLSGVTVKTEPR